MSVLMELLGRYSNQNIATRIRQVLAGQEPDDLPGRPTRPRKRQERWNRSTEWSSATSWASDQAADRRVRGEPEDAVDPTRQARCGNPLSVGSQDQLTEATKLYAEGSSLVMVGDQFGVNAGTLLNAVKRIGVQTRPVVTISGDSVGGRSVCSNQWV